MEWVWVGALVLVVYPLLQVPLALYVTRRCDLEPENPADLPDQRYWVDERPDRHPASSGTIRCGRCGRENESGFTYCRGCVARLATVGT